jgi:hypothetical protein
MMSTSRSTALLLTRASGCKTEKQKFIEGSMKERAYLLHHKLNHQGLNVFLLEIWVHFLKQQEEVGLWFDVDARDGLSADVHVAAFFQK